MPENKHTPGPWHRSESGDTTYIIGHPTWPCSRNGHEQEWEVAVIDDLLGEHPAEARANARLIAAAPDHALIGWAMCVAAGRWEPLGDMSGEFCINGIRHMTKLDEFGCPAMSAGMRVAILKAQGASS
jgi:hypothetical protein